MKKNTRKNKQNCQQNKLKMPDPSHHFREVSEENPSLHGFMMMVNTLAGRTNSQIELYKTNFDDNSSYKLSDDENFYMTINLQMMVEDIGAVLFATQTFEDNEKNKLPLSDNCFDFLAEYINGARGVVSTLMAHFSEDQPEQGSDEKIIKCLNSLKLAIQNINDIYSKFCKTKGMLQA